MVTLNLYPCFEHKSLKFCERIAYGEHVAVNVHFSEAQTDVSSLRVRVRHNGTEVARCSSFTVSEGDSKIATGVLNLYTTKLGEIFEELPDLTEVVCVIIVDALVDATSASSLQAMYAASTISVMNWAEPELGSTPTDIGTLESTVKTLQEDLNAHEAASDAHEALFSGKADAATLASHLANTTDAHGLAGIKNTLSGLSTRVGECEAKSTKISEFKAALTASLATAESLPSGTLAQIRARQNAVIQAIVAGLNQL